MSPNLDDPTVVADYAAGVRRLARGLVSADRVEDVVQETMLALVRGQGRIRVGLGAWLAGVARNAARRIARGEARRARREIARPEARRAAAPAAVDVVARLDERARVLALVRALDEPFRTAVWLRYFEGLPPRTIAARLGVPVETVKSRLKRALARLRERLDAQHDGDRSAWLGALLPLLPRGNLLSPVLGGIAVKKTIVALVVLLLLALAGGGAWLLLSGPSAVRPPAPDRPERLAADGSGSPAEPAASDAAERETDAAGADAESPAVAAGPEEEAAGAAAPAVAEFDPGRPAAIPLNPRNPPAPKPGQTSVGGGSGPRPTGHWSKFPPAKPRGPAALEVLVLDRDGRPVAGADVYVGHPDLAGEAAVSYGHLHAVGKTGADGRLRATRLPEGNAAVAANLEGLLSGRGGLDMSSATRVTLSAVRPAAAEVRLPLSLGDYGGVRGVVRGPAGAPLANAAVATGYRRVYTDAEGRFVLPRLEAGTHRIAVSRTGYRSAAPEVDVRAGDTVEIEVDLPYAEEGTLDLVGTVTGPEGEPVADADVYVIAASRGGSGTIRSGRTDAHGRFSMASLPDRLADTEVRIQASASGYATGNAAFPDGFPGGEVGVRLPERYVRLVLTVEDGPSGGPLDRCRLSVRKAGDAEWRTAFSAAADDGVYRTWLSAGRWDLLVEAPDHEAHQTTVELDPPGAERIYTAKLTRAPEPADEVALTLTIVSATTGDPVAAVRISILPERGDDPVARLDTSREDGVYTMPAPSGRWRIRVEAEGFETRDEAVDLPAEKPETRREIRLTPR